MLSSKGSASPTAPEIRALVACDKFKDAITANEACSIIRRTLNLQRPEWEIDADIEKLIEKRNAIRPWGWNTGRNWKDDIPPEVLKR